MKKRIRIKNIDYYIQQYTTILELRLLEFIELNNNLTNEEYIVCAKEFLKEIGVSIDNITDEEIIILLLKVREHTIGTDLKLNVSCPSCCKKFASTIDLTDVYKEAKLENTFDDNNFVSKEYFDTIDDSVIPDDMDWDQYDIIHKNLIDYYSIYNLNFKLKCPLCGHDMLFSIDSVYKALTFLSEESIQSLMTVIHNLTYYDNISRSDVLQMTPIERLIEISLLKNTKEKQNNVLNT